MFFSFEKCDVTIMFKSWLWSYHSCLLLSSSLSSTHTQIFTDHILFVIFFYHYSLSKFSTEVVFSGKKCDLRKWKHLLERFGSIEVNRAVLLAWTWTPAKKPTDVICRWECHDWASCRRALFTGRNFSFFLEFPTEQELWSLINNVLFWTQIYIK